MRAGQTDRNGVAQVSEGQQGGLLLTGATGFLGGQILARQLERSDRHVHAVVRAADEGQARARLEGVMASIYGSPHAHPHPPTPPPGGPPPPPPPPPGGPCPSGASAWSRGAWTSLPSRSATCCTRPLRSRSRTRSTG